MDIQNNNADIRNGHMWHWLLNNGELPFSAVQIEKDINKEMV